MFRIALTGVATGLWLLAGLLPATAARAADPAMAELLKILRERGSLSDAEYEALSKAAGESGSTAPEADGANAPAATVAPVIVPGASDGEQGGEAVAPTLETVAEKVDADSKRIDEAEAELDEQKKSFLRIKEIADGTSSDTVAKALEGKWYERISLRGYTQFRLSEVLSQTGPDLEVPADRSVRDNEMFVIRRGRFIFSGDASDHVFLYGQLDFNASAGTGDTSLQMRDLYADIALDAKKEFRFRVGQSKVPFGFVNLQSSQNRAPFERPDALNSTAEGERDYGAYFMWAPAEIRQRFKDLVKLGLKGSGDYGVVALGTYAGQGPNRSDQNGEPYLVARTTWPFALSNGQIFEIGAQYHYGRFVTSATEVDLGGGPLTPDQPSNGAIDQRGALTFVWYPQPFGFEAEWNVGEGPELNPDGDRVEARFLHGGYVQHHYTRDTTIGTFFPFTRWNYYAGGRKFANNAPGETVNEIDAGFEYAPWPELELTLMYTHSFERTNTRSAPYDDTKKAERIGAQVQWNY